MLIIPAVDIMSGKVVRLSKGVFDTSKIYNESPLEYSKKWQDEGASLIHVVDLDGAKSGSLSNLLVIKDIIKNSRVPIEVGGGIRSVEAVATYLNAGAGRVVLSTKILEEPSFLLAPALKGFLNKIAVSIDIKQLQSSDVVTSGTAGWSENGDILLDIPSFIKTLSSVGVLFVNFSDISRDGMLSGPDIVKITHFLKLARKHATSKLFFTYAGGISSLEDIKGLKDLGDEGADAIIVGKALYEGRFSLKEAIACLR